LSRYVRGNINYAGDYYSPGTYLRLLSWYHDLEVQADNLGPEFIPLTATRPNPMTPTKVPLPAATQEDFDDGQGWEAFQRARDARAAQFPESTEET